MIMNYNDKIILIVLGLNAVCFILFFYILISERKKERIAQKEKRLNWILSLNLPYKIHYLEEEWNELKELFEQK